MILPRAVDSLYYRPIIWMRSMKKQLPQFTRFFSASTLQASMARWLRLGLWAGLGFLLIINIAIRLPASFASIPATLAAHTDSAWKLWHNGHHAEAVQELRGSLSMITEQHASSTVLGVTDTASSQSLPYQTQDTLEASYLYWKSITQQYPTYRDGYLAFALVAYQLNKQDEVEAAITQAKFLDPNGEIPRVFEVLIKK